MAYIEKKKPKWITKKKPRDKEGPTATPDPKRAPRTDSPYQPFKSAIKSGKGKGKWITKKEKPKWITKKEKPKWITRKKLGPPAGTRNLLEEVGRIDAEPMDPNRAAEKKRVIRELNEGYNSGGKVSPATHKRNKESAKVFKLMKGKPKLAKRGWK